MVGGRWWCTPGGGYGGASQVFTSTSSRQPPQNIARSLPGRGGGGGLRFEFTLEALQLASSTNKKLLLRLQNTPVRNGECRLDLLGWEVLES